MLFIYGLVNMMHCVTQIMCGVTHTLCHGQHNWLCGIFRAYFLFLTLSLNIHLKTTCFFNMEGGPVLALTQSVGRTTHNLGHTMHHVDPTIAE